MKLLNFSLTLTLPRAWRRVKNTLEKSLEKPKNKQLFLFHLVHKSCLQIKKQKQDATSAFYWLTFKGHEIQGFCDMETVGGESFF